MKCHANNVNDETDGRKCYRCNNVGHISRDCLEQRNVKKAGAVIEAQHTHEIDELIEDEELALLNGIEVNLASNTVTSIQGRKQDASGERLSQ